MDQASSRSPDDTELLNMAIESWLADVHTCMPGRVDSYDPETQRATIKPLIKRLIVHEDGSEALEELPPITDVPVIFLRAAGFFLSFPMEEGDLVTLHFAETSIDKYMAGTGADTNPDEFRHHDLSDAIAVPGFYPFKRSIKDISSVNLVMGKDDGGVQIHLTADGTMELKVEGDADEAVALGNALKLFWDSVFKPVYDVHTHTAPSGGGPTTPPLAPAPSFDTSIISTIFKLKKG